MTRFCLLAVFTSVLLANTAFSKNVFIPLSVKYVGSNYIDPPSNLPIVPGDVIIIRNGTRPQLKFEGLIGSVTQPITITNEIGGRVIIDHVEPEGVHYGLIIDACQYIVLTGSANQVAPNHEDYYGIKVCLPKANTMLGAGTGTSDLTIERVEVVGTKFAANGSENPGQMIQVKSDPRCFVVDGKNTIQFSSNTFILTNLYIRDNYIHGPGLEAIYVGHTRESVSADCDITFVTKGIEPIFKNGRLYELLPIDIPIGHYTTLYTHTLDNVVIENNRIEDVGGDGIQVTRASNVVIRNNKIENYGTHNTQSHLYGITAGQFSGDIYNNYVGNGTGKGIVIHPIGNANVINNFVHHTGHIKDASGNYTLGTIPAEYEGSITCYMNDLDFNFNRGNSAVGPKKLIIANNLVWNAAKYGIVADASGGSDVFPPNNQNGEYIILNNVISEPKGSNSPGANNAEPFIRVSNSFIFDYNRIYSGLSKLMIKNYDGDLNQLGLANISSIDKREWDLTPSRQSPLVNSGENFQEIFNYPDYMGQDRVLGLAAVPGLGQRTSTSNLIAVDKGPVELRLLLGSGPIIFKP